MALTLPYPLSSPNTALLFIVVAANLLSLSSTLPPSPSATRPFKKIYAFGDSYTDTGNTMSTTGPSGFNYVSSLPYGSTFFHHPTNRYSDGRLVIDFVTQALSLPYLSPYLSKTADKSSGINFAVAGATAIRHSFFVKNNMTLNITPQSLGSQLVWFDRSLESMGCGDGAKLAKCKEEFSDSLFWVGEIGANDYAYTLGTSVKYSTIQQLAIKGHTDFLQALLRKGAKYVVVQGLPPTGCLTLTLALSPEEDRDSLGCVGSANNLSSHHNALLQSQINGLQKKFPQATIVYADYYNAYQTIMKNRSKYGIKEPFKVCCGTGNGEYNYDIFNACGSPSSKACSDMSTYINWDGVHLTEAMYKAVSDLLLNQGFSHPSFEYLLSKKKHETGK